MVGRKNIFSLFQDWYSIVLFNSQFCQYYDGTVVEVVFFCLTVGSVGGVVRTFGDVAYRWLWLFRWKTKVGIIFDNTMKCGKVIRDYVQLRSAGRSKFNFKYVSAHGIKKLQVCCYYMCIALTLQPYRFHRGRLLITYLV